MAGCRAAVVVASVLVATSCSLTFGDDTEAALIEAADEAALAARTAESVNTAAGAALRDAQAVLNAAQIRMDDTQRALETNPTLYAFAEWSAAFDEGIAAQAEAHRAQAKAGETHLASWEAQAVWMEALLTVEEYRAGGPVLTIEGIHLEILAGLARETVDLVEERNQAMGELGAATARTLEITGQLMAAAWAGDFEAVESLGAEGDRAIADMDRAERRFDRADAEVYHANARWSAAIEQAMRYGVDG